MTGSFNFYIYFIFFITQVSSNSTTSGSVSNDTPKSRNDRVSTLYLVLIIFFVAGILGCSLFRICGYCCSYYLGDYFVHCCYCQCCRNNSPDHFPVATATILGGSTRVATEDEVDIITTALPSSSSSAVNADPSDIYAYVDCSAVQSAGMEREPPRASALPPPSALY